MWRQDKDIDNYKGALFDLEWGNGSSA